MGKKRYEVKLGDDLLYVIVSELLKDIETRLKEKRELVRYEAGNIFIDDDNKVDYGQATPVKDVRESFHQLGLTLFYLATGTDWQAELLPSLNSRYERLIASLISNKIVSLSQARALLKPPNKTMQTLKKIFSPIGLILGWLFCGFALIAKGIKNWFCENGEDLLYFIWKAIIPWGIIIAAIAMVIYLLFLSGFFWNMAEVCILILCILLLAVIIAGIVDSVTDNKGKPAVMAFFIAILVMSIFITFKTPSYLSSNLNSKSSSIILVNRSDGEFYRRFALNGNDELLTYNHRFVNLFTKKYAQGIAAAKNDLAVEASLGESKLRLAASYALTRDEDYLRNLIVFQRQEKLEEYLIDIIKKEAVAALAECLPTETTCSVFANPGMESAGSIMAGMSEELSQHRRRIIEVISLNTQLRLSEAGLMTDGVYITEWPADKNWPSN
ncbi:MAG: hypothetical protein WCT16_02005 [Candidatus Buchananbacteria bacterium]